MKRSICIAALVGLAVALAAGSTRAATLNVAPHGVDDGACGSKTAPCRTITRAIANAGVGDTVLVAAGRYGDVDGNHSISGAAEELPDVNGCGCILEIGKHVKVISRDGASATVLDAGRSGFDLVRLSADGAQFGKKNQGFTLTGTDTNRSALDVTGNDNTIAGHIVTGNNSDGYFIHGSRNLITASRLMANGGEAFLVTGDDNVITETVVSGAYSIGFNINGNRNVLRSVVAVGNGSGIALSGTGHVATTSVAVANTNAGIGVGGTGAVITKTNLFGNSTSDPVSNCGLSTFGTANATATGNYWGAPTGPGPDPADVACVNAGGTATTSPFASKALKTPTKPLR